MPSLNLDYHYGTEAEQYSFYRTPKLLFYDAQFAHISLEAKVLYGMMIDRMSLSIQNHWADEHGRIYIYFTMEEACKLLGIGRTKMVRIMAELDNQKGIGLIERRKQGQGKPTIIYVKNFTSIPQTTSKPRKTTGNRKPKTASNETSEPLEPSVAPAEEAYLPPENQFSYVLNSRLELSASSEYEPQEVRRRNTSNTNVNKTKRNETESISPSKCPSLTPPSAVNESDGEREGWSLIDEVSEALYEQEGIPFVYTQDVPRMTTAIHLLTDYDGHCQNSGGNSFQLSAFKLFNQALIEMLTATRAMELRGGHVTSGKVYEKLTQYLNFDGDTPMLMELPELIVDDYMHACQKREIKHHLAYMKSCIWYVLQVGDIGLQAQIHRDFSSPTESQ